MEGYEARGGQPDTAWWMQQVNAGITFRKKWALDSSWDTWRSYYRGRWKPGVMPVNLFFSMLRSIVPRIYFRNPSVSIVPSMPGFEVMAFAKVLERVDNKMMREMGMKNELKRIVQDTFLFGTGWGKLGFGAFNQPTPEFGDTGQPISNKGERVEYRDKVYQNMPWFARTHTGSVIVPDGLQVYEDTRWVAHWLKRPVEDVKADPRFKNTNGLGSSGLRATSLGSVASGIEMADLVEIRDKKLGVVMVIAPYSDKDGQLLFFGEDEFLNRGAFPMRPAVFNPDDEVFWGIPDSVIIEPYQLEINEIRTQMMHHRRLSLIKMLHKKGTIHENEMAKMTSEEVLASVEVDGELDDIKLVQAANIPNDILIAARELKEDFREAVGFSRNQFGEYKPGSRDVTATEASIVQQASEIRIDERRDVMADVIVDTIEGMHQIIFNHWGGEQIVDVIGPGGEQVWVKFTGTMLGKGQYTVKIDPDSSVPETKQSREAKAAQVYTLLKENPMIDPQRLTQYLLHEMHGVQFDDIMRALPTAENSPTSPISPQDFGGLIQSQVARAANGERPASSQNGTGV